MALLKQIALAPARLAYSAARCAMMDRGVSIAVGDPLEGCVSTCIMSQ